MGRGWTNRALSVAGEVNSGRITCIGHFSGCIFQAAMQISNIEVVRTYLTESMAEQLKTEQGGNELFL